MKSGDLRKIQRHLPFDSITTFNLVPGWINLLVSRIHLKSVETGMDGCVTEASGVCWRNKITRCNHDTELRLVQKQKKQKRADECVRKYRSHLVLLHPQCCLTYDCGRLAKLFAGKHCADMLTLPTKQNPSKRHLYHKSSRTGEVDEPAN